MTEMARRRRTRPARSPRRPSTLLVAVWAAVSSALAGLAVTCALVLVTWSAEPRSTASTGQALGVGVQTWLLSHHGTLRLSTGPVGLLPLGLVVLPAVLLLRSGISTARVLRVDDLPGAGRAVTMLACVYAVLVTGVTGLVGGEQVSVSPVGTLFGAAVVAGLFGGVGVLRGAGLGRRAFRLLPAHGRLVVRAAGVALGTLLATGALVTGAALAADLARARDLSHALTPGLLGGFGLVLLGLLYTPNAVVWGAAYTTGPGFAFGTGTSVSVFGVTLGPVPAFPLLAALPEGEHTSTAGWLLLTAPLAAGLLAGMFVARRLATGDYGAPHRPGAAGLWAGAAGLVAGVLFGLVAALSGGPLGSGRLAVVGPSPWQVGLAAGVEIAVAGGVTAAALCRSVTRGGGSRVGRNAPPTLTNRVRGRRP